MEDTTNQTDTSAASDASAEVVTTGENVLVEAEKQPEVLIDTPVVEIDPSAPGTVTPILNLDAAVPNTDPVPVPPTAEQQAQRAAAFPIEQYPDGWYVAFNGDANQTHIVRLYQPIPSEDGTQLPRGLGFNAADGGGFAPLGVLNNSVILRQLLPDNHHFHKSCLVINAAQANDPIEKWQAVQSNRFIAETNLGTLQVIPYIVLMNEDDEILSYVRGMSGGESRLHMKLSIGMGGHIDSAVATTVEDLIVAEAAREIIEEVGFVGENLIERLRAAFKLAVKLQSQATPVDAVHIGLGFVLRVRKSEITKFEEDVVTQASWNPLQELQLVVDGKADGDKVVREYELWSKIMIGYIDHLQKLQKAFTPV